MTRLPALLGEVEDKLKVTRDALNVLPQRTITDPIAEMWNMLSMFKTDVDSLVAGRPDDRSDGLIQGLRASKQRFRQEIFAGAPQFQAFPSSSTQPPVTLESEEQLELETPASDTTVTLEEVVAQAERWGVCSP